MKDAPPLVPRTAPLELAPDLIPHASPFLCDLRIEAASLSRVIPHVSNIEYVRWLDRAAELHADACGWTRDRLLDAGLMWFVARHEIDYLAETWADDDLVVATWVRDVRRVRSWRDCVIVRPTDDAVVCRAATLWVLVELESRRPFEIPDDMALALDPLFGVRRARRPAPR